MKLKSWDEPDVKTRLPVTILYVTGVEITLMFKSSWS